MIMEQSIYSSNISKSEVLAKRFSRDWRVVSYDDIAANY